MAEQFDENEIEFGRAAVAMMVHRLRPGASSLVGDVCHARIPANVNRANSARRLASCRHRSAGR
jgi:hypothetical protein